MKECGTSSKPPCEGIIQVCSAGKESSCNTGDTGPIPGSGRSTGEGIGYSLHYSWAALVAQLVKNLSATQETWVQDVFDSWVGKILWRKEQLPTPVFRPGHKELNTTQ